MEENLSSLKLTDTSQYTGDLLTSINRLLTSQQNTTTAHQTSLTGTQISHSKAVIPLLRILYQQAQRAFPDTKDILQDI